MKRYAKVEKYIDAAYEYVEGISHTADDKKNLMWNGWALRDAFIAGTKCAEYARIEASPLSRILKLLFGKHRTK